MLIAALVSKDAACTVGMAIISQWKSSVSETTAFLPSAAPNVGRASAMHVNVPVKLLVQV